MTKHVLLNNIAHKDLKVITRHSPDYGDNISAVLTFPTEFADVQREYPILLRKDDTTGDFQAVALLGLAKNDNLFLEDGGWQASYVPAIMARGPFLIGFQEQEVEGEVRREAVIHVDMDDPRVNDTEGEAVFLEHGGNSPYLERIVTVLNGIHSGMSYAAAMYQALAEFELIEPVNLNIQVSQDEQYSLSNFYTVSDERLAALDGDTLVKLNRAGFLEGAYLIKASLTNIKTLIELRRKRLAQRA
ncbi:SapC family protein [Gilvimarinus algae]|uniref:SapC family protein n=1 Tax=Gilvimarinus algae TaxID=3058037 RepID=A0ABT8TD45_9GAMM|nr:SapC family protein [Gilvimarinus sp. SDUM040014]MDO3382036.1 SapC family protein [Gilvimarinus sp. SDUM040014]